MKTMKTVVCAVAVGFAAVALTLTIAGCRSGVRGERRISVAEYRDRMEAAWLGQIAGVAWGAPTEFQFVGRIIPDDYERLIHSWSPEMVNRAFNQDDVYVEMTFLESLDRWGYDVPIRRLGIEFANSTYRLWHANDEGRNNLRFGIAPPASSHPLHNCCSADIDYQIEADFSGILSPGLPQGAIALGERFGRLMNYGDGLYAGQFVGGLYSAAFFERDIVTVVREALRCIPAQSRYAEMVRDILGWYDEDPNDWERAWHLIVDKYGHEKGCPTEKGAINAGLNGGMVLLGLLWGHGEIDRTILISTRAGYDSDCNPSTAAGVLFTLIGKSKLPACYYEALDRSRRFEHTNFTFPKLLEVCEKVAREVVVANGGRIERDSNGTEWFVVPVADPVPSAYEDWQNPGPCGEERFTDAEMAEIIYQGDYRTGRDRWARPSVRKE